MMNRLKTLINRTDGAVLARAVVLSCAALLVAAAGCASPQSAGTGNLQIAGNPQYGAVYYLDGAGGGGLTNWEGGLKKGLIEAGYKGQLSMFPWETGLGVVVDQDTAVRYKRQKADEVAAEIVRFHRAYPASPIHLIGLSAGTAVAVFAVEALPPNLKVENVILFGASISNDYDLTKALGHVRTHLYNFTSEHDAVLGFLVPMSGTADRTDAPAAGLDGFVMPPGANAQTRRLYLTKVVRIAWKAKYERDGDYGGHTGGVNASFVRDYVAPLIMRD
jgi:pimeloyl-ACP methyl ester carboxylesterase